MSINLYGQLGRMPKKVEELKDVLEKIVQEYDIKKIEVYLNNPK